MGFIRLFSLHVHGVQVLVIDRQRMPAHVVADLASMVVLLFWYYEIFAHACRWPLLIPRWLEIALITSDGVRLAGCLVLLSALVVFGFALHSLGASWRIGIDRTKTGTLVTKGIYAWSRNPIYLSLNQEGGQDRHDLAGLHLQPRPQRPEGRCVSAVTREPGRDRCA
jgi:protein-S-isoprenylcysteine O-methyltransferase Ste14